MLSLASGHRDSKIQNHGWIANLEKRAGIIVPSVPTENPLPKGRGDVGRAVVCSLFKC